MSHPALPPRVSRPWLAVAATVWCLAGVVSSRGAPPAHPAGPVTFEAVLVSDVVAGRYGPFAVARTEEHTFLLDLDDHPDVGIGSRVAVEGVANGRPGRARGEWHSSTVAVRRFTALGANQSPHLVVGNAVRQRVVDRLAPFDDGRALVAGFLIGDTNHLDPADVEAMRLSGLSHFVAVSGSNVALFLGLLAIAAGPLALGPRRRAVVGLIGLPVYAAATRFEPSVMRASVMAGIALMGRLVGVVLEAWQLLALAVVVLLASDPSLSQSPGFQLSVAATGGVLIGGRWPVGGGKVQRALLVTCGAQLAVAPLLLVHFGSVPLLSPIANLVAAPLVAASTLTGAIGVAGPRLLVDVAAALAELVLTLSRGASVWPQVGAPAVAAGVGSGVLLWRVPPLRVPAAIVVAGVSVVAVVVRGPALPDAGALVLDVGQGDAVLLHGGEGRFALVDGGPDPVILGQKLRSLGVTALELMVATHVHADHVTGLTGVIGSVVVSEIWADFTPHETPSSVRFLARAGEWGVPIRAPRPGHTARVGDLTLEVVGPIRRYKSPNDQSLVILVTGPVRTLLLAGDVETVAQAELGGLMADVLKVPHQGAATSDPAWLVSVGAELAVISVGPNQFGHPAEWVIATLEDAGTRVRRTDHDGDVVVDLGP